MDNFLMDLYHILVNDILMGLLNIMGMLLVYSPHTVLALYVIFAVLLVLHAIFSILEFLRWLRSLYCNSNIRLFEGLKPVILQIYHALTGRRGKQPSTLSIRRGQTTISVPPREPDLPGPAMHKDCEELRKRLQQQIHHMSQENSALIYSVFKATFPNGFEKILADKGFILRGMYAPLKTMEAMYPSLPRPSVGGFIETCTSERCAEAVSSLQSQQDNHSLLYRMSNVLCHWGPIHGKNLRLACLFQDGRLCAPELPPSTDMEIPPTTGGTTFIWVYVDRTFNAPIVWDDFFGMRPLNEEQDPPPEDVQIQDIRNQLQQAREERDNANQQLQRQESLETEIEALRQELLQTQRDQQIRETARDNLDDLRAQIQQAKRSQAESEQELHRVKQELDEASDAKQEVQTSVEQELQNMQTRLDEANERLQAQALSVNELQNVSNQLDEANERLRSQESLKSELQIVKDQLAQATQQLSQQTSQQTPDDHNLRQKIDEQAQGIEQLRSEANRVCVEQQAEIDCLKRDLETSNQLAQTNQTNVESLRNENNNLSHELRDVQQNLDRAQDSVQRVTNERDNLRSLLDQPRVQLQRDLDLLRTGNLEHQRRGEQLQNDLDAARHNLEQAQSQVAKLTDQVANLTLDPQSKEKLERDNKWLHSEVQRLSNELNAFRDSNQTITKLQKDVGRLQGELTQERLRRAETEGRYNKKVTELNLLKQQTSGGAEKARVAQQTIDKLRATVQRQQQQQSQAQASHQQTIGSLQAQQQLQQQQLQQRNGELGNQLASLRADFDRERTENGVLVSERDHAQAGVEKLQSDIAKLRDDQTEERRLRDEQEKERQQYDERDRKILENQVESYRHMANHWADRIIELQKLGILDENQEYKGATQQAPKKKKKDRKHVRDDGDSDEGVVQDIPHRPTPPPRPNIDDNKSSMPVRKQRENIRRLPRRAQDGPNTQASTTTQAPSYDFSGVSSKNDTADQRPAKKSRPVTDWAQSDSDEDSLFGGRLEELDIEGDDPIDQPASPVASPAAASPVAAPAASPVVGSNVATDEELAAALEEHMALDDDANDDAAGDAAAPAAGLGGNDNNNAGTQADEFDDVEEDEDMYGPPAPRQSQNQSQSQPQLQPQIAAVANTGNNNNSNNDIDSDGYTGVEDFGEDQVEY